MLIIDPKLRMLDMEIQILSKGSSIHRQVLIKNAQEEGMLTTVMDMVQKAFAPKVEAALEGKEKNSHTVVGVVLDLVAPVLSWTLGFKKFSILISIAEACGFDFDAAINFIKEKLGPIAASATHGLGFDDVYSTVKDGLASATHGFDLGKLLDALKNNTGDLLSGLLKSVTGNDDSINNLILVRNIIGNPAMANKIVKNAGLLDKLKGGIFSFLAKYLCYALLGLLAIAGLYYGAKSLGLIGKDGPGGEDPKSLAEQEKTMLFKNENLPPEIEVREPNTSGERWRLPFNISSLESKMKEWAKLIYNISPEACQQSPKFAKVLQNFKAINPSGTSAPVLVVPDVYHSILDIVDNFALDATAHEKKLA